ncbi:MULTISPECIES: hypothetical protein [unclassified Streptomyces]|uniref:hypothetical protein n=1 Tax=unclassified Streptomyces TaxID=2593676 RepID=UPI00115F7CBC|nr:MULTISPECIES: hypothetical protein [unclassified Streptomyces]
MLPLEAIELDAFRRRHRHDTFWCGLLLGGCGTQLTTKLYMDRVCHFAHHPGPDDQPHICGRRSRGVSSADHLYVKSAAAAWLRERDEQAEIGFGQADGAPIGSVVDIASQGWWLRVHLDQAVEPVWDDDDIEPVLGVSVPINRDTLIRRWYVHRIRLDSEGTARRIRIGTEAFARPTEWFALDECEIAEQGLSTPAVERIVRSRRTAPPLRWSAGRARKAPEPDARAQVLLRRLTDARRVDSVVVVTRVCREIAALAGASPEAQDQLHAAVRDAQVWLEKQAEVRRDLFARLDEVVSARKTAPVRELLVRVNAIAAHDRTEAEDQIVGAAADFLSAQARGQHALDAQREAEEAAGRIAATAALAASHEVSRNLRDLRRQPARHISEATLRSQVQALVKAAAEAGRHITPSQKRQLNQWKSRAGIGRARTSAPTAVTPDMHTASSKKSAITIPVWVWKDRYGGLHADINQTRPEASVLDVPLPFDAGPLQRLYGNLTRMIVEQEASKVPVHTNRASLAVRVWETSNGQLDATLTRRKGATVATLPLPVDLEWLREWHDKVVAQMKDRGIAQQPWAKRNPARGKN